MHLRKKTLSGVVWTITETVILRGSTFLASIYLARILGPKEYGLFGMVAIFIAIGTSLVDSGMTASLIRTKDAKEEDYSTVFFLNLGISIIVYIIIYFGAPFVSVFFNQNLLTSIMRVYCLSFVITAFSAVQTAKLDAEMNFKRSAILGLPGTILGILVGIVIADLGFGVWSIIWMLLTAQFVKALCLWLFSNWKPKFIFSRIKAKHHYNFGYKLLLAGLLNTTFEYIYNIIIGKFYPVQTLGYFERARYFNEYPSSVLAGVFTRVTYPLLSQLQDDEEKLSQIFKQLNKVLFFCISPLMLGLAALAKPGFLLVLGEEWLPAVIFFQILSLAFMFFPLHILSLNVVKVFGRSDLFLRLEIIKKGMVLISIIIAFQFGLLGLVWSIVFTSFIGLIINSHYSAEMIKYSFKELLLDILPSLVLSGVMFGIIVGVISLMGNYLSIMQILAGGISGFVFYLGINYVFKTPPLLYILQIIKERKL